MKHLKNERGNGMVYILWIMVVSIVIFVIVVNIGKVYAVKQQAATATQQAALAGTAVLVQATKTGIMQFDTSGSDESKEQKEADDGKSIEMLVDEKMKEYQKSGQTKDIAYINALNAVLPSRIASYSELNEKISQQIKDAKLSFTEVVRDVLMRNGANLERSVVIFSLSERRVEVEADTTFESITDTVEMYIKSFEEEIKQKGYGPSLKYFSGM